MFLKCTKRSFFSYENSFLKKSYKKKFEQRIPKRMFFGALAYNHIRGPKSDHIIHLMHFLSFSSIPALKCAGIFVSPMFLFYRLCAYWVFTMMSIWRSIFYLPLQSHHFFFCSWFLSIIYYKNSFKNIIQFSFLLDYVAGRAFTVMYASE